MKNPISTFNQNEIENRIFTIRGMQVMIDRDLAELYGVLTKRINEQVKRNASRFPEQFCFQLNEYEKIELVANCDRFKSLKHSSSFPIVFTEQGVAMLSAILRSETAVTVSIQIINAFVQMRKFITNHAALFQRLESVEHKMRDADNKFERIFKALESHETQPKNGIFFDGQVFDAYVFISDLIRSATKSISLIDNYIDKSILLLLTKRRSGVKVSIYTKPGKVMQQDVDKHNSQYEPVEIIALTASHDRFLIIDEKDFYHIGASLKDLGKKWFAFSKMDVGSLDLLKKINELK
ncbi:MAG: ORF6N domain-containing protein [Bacteroidales bacterium]